MAGRERDDEAVLDAEEVSPGARKASASALAFGKSSPASASTSASSGSDDEHAWVGLLRRRPCLRSARPARPVPEARAQLAAWAKLGETGICPQVQQVEVGEACDVFVEGLGCILEEMVPRAASQRGQEPTSFDSLSAPAMSIRDYIARLSRYSGCSKECFVFALVYIDRIVQCDGGIVVSQLSVHRLASAAWLLAVKFNDDNFYTNAHYARVAGVELFELNRLEGEFLHAIAWRLQVLPEEYESYRGLMAETVDLRKRLAAEETGRASKRRRLMGKQQPPRQD